jgi:hypothetical protein
LPWRPINDSIGILTNELQPSSRKLLTVVHSKLGRLSPGIDHISDALA